ncbi:hypothetical protein [Agrilutibacter solisilvae]|uniref:Uncharacterized protein n=1 Tax=Agrilutibacter solisilvae TaxID=2763317 RepID=A0A974XZT6_9GAMM|nr:hypothetical protein [Lysobacter solisilvae]QSX77975.1 hypothetical protein I8J32_014810 [Lysobacter solisilvae]
MEERIARLKTSDDARRLAENARRLGHPELGARALQRASELQAAEEGFSTPAEQAIAIALYAYEDEQSRLKERTFRANRTRQMLDRHGALIAAERMVLSRQPSKGFEVLEEAGLQALSFEAIIDRFPGEFSAAAVEAARARLEGRPSPRAVSEDAPSEAGAFGEENDSLAPPTLDAEAVAFLKGFKDPNGWFLTRWMPRYRETTQAISQALRQDRPQDVFEIVWKSPDNAISNAGPGLLKYETVEAMRNDLLEVIRQIHSDGSPASFNRIVERFERWKAEGRIGKVPRLLIARAFAGVHPARYHTTVDGDRHNEVLGWFVQHTGFIRPRSGSWAASAQALVGHLDQLGVFDDILARNMFPWFVADQLSVRTARAAVPPGHQPRALAAFAELPPAQRIIALRHNAIQTALFDRLATELGRDRVWTEYPTGTGGFADAITRLPDGRCHLYEIKVADSAAEVVRLAMGQLLEYGFRQGGLEPVKLFVVGEPALDAVTNIFVARLRADFNLPIEYLQVELPDT